MFDPKKLKVGDVFYSVKERNQSFHRKKIHQEIDGQDWFRYDRPLRTYEIETYKVLGIIRKELEGQWKLGDPEWDLETEFFIQRQDETHVRNVVIFLDEEDKYYIDKEEALEYIKTLEINAKEMDKT